MERKKIRLKYSTRRKCHRLRSINMILFWKNRLKVFSLQLIWTKSAKTKLISNLLWQMMMAMPYPTCLHQHKTSTTWRRLAYRMTIRSRFLTRYGKYQWYLVRPQKWKLPMELWRRSISRRLLKKPPKMEQIHLFPGQSLIFTKMRLVP